MPTFQPGHHFTIATIAAQLPRLRLLGVLVLLASCGGNPANPVLDGDDDGSPADKDCNDSEPSIHPGATEVPYDGVDQDCDGKDLTDVDGDGFAGGPTGADCQDQDATVHPGAAEICGDGIDQDCDGEDLSCDDVDSDGDGYTPAKGDCDDHDAAVHPGTETPYNGKDDDCNAETLDDDLDADGYKHDVDCNDADATIHPGAPDLPYDGIDQDCDGKDVADVDGDGDPTPIAGGGDCDDHDPTVSSLRTEVLYNGKDDDCDPTTPDDDVDGDGYDHTTDCNDMDRTVFPGAQEVAYDGIDQDCSGSDLTDVDGDGHDAVAAGGDDCDDRNPAAHPGALEIPYDGTDNDCDPSTLDDDLDVDGFRHDTDCDDTDPTVNSGRMEIAYNGKDDDCNPKTLDEDLDSDGFDHDVDCNDNDASIHPGAKEVVGDGIDQDCDGTDPIDDDGDGYTSIATGGKDCDDTSKDVHPGAKEVCENGIDENCDGHDADCNLYWKEGVQNDVDPDALAGWTECYSNGFDDDDETAVPPADCDGKQLMMACRNTDDATIRVLAMGHRDDVLFDTGDIDVHLGGTTTHSGNGVEWYFHQRANDDDQPLSSWGFAPDGVDVYLIYCDEFELYNFQGNWESRVCFNLKGDHWAAGWRCGDTDSLLSGGHGTWKRVIYTSNLNPP